MFERVEIVPAYKTVCEAIEREILNGTLVPGDQLPTETELAEQFGLTRHTVREGIRILEQSGLVQRDSGRRLYVTTPHYAELASRASRALIMQRVSFRDLWEVSLELEPYAAGLAAPRISERDIGLLKANHAAMAGRINDHAAVVELDSEFHTIIAEAAGNQALLLAREPVSLLFYPSLRRLFAHERTEVIAPRRLLYAHQEIIQGLERRDKTHARNWMHKHMIDFRRGYDICGYDLDDAVGMNAA